MPGSNKKYMPHWQVYPKTGYVPMNKPPCTLEATVVNLHRIYK